MEFIPLSFIAGVLTVLAPCILPLLPIIIGGSLSEQDKKRPLIITASLALSIVLFTLLLKVSTLFVNIPQDFWKWFSSVIVLFFALSLLFPDLWPKLLLWFKKVTNHQEGAAEKSQKILFQFYEKKGVLPAIILGAALGPVFASCSPTYFLILGTVLPANFFVGLVNLIVYALGLALVMFLLAYAGQKFSPLLARAADPKGWFKRGLGILFLLVALMIVTGYDKKLGTLILDKGFFDVTKIEQKILDQKIDLNPIKIIKDIKGFKSPLFVSYPAPELAGLENWINSNGYNSMQELRGKVVLVDFWTYSCINCIRTLPHLEKLHQDYADDGLVILGIHAPEFAFERNIDNLKKAVDDYGLSYPIVQDNDFTTWKNYQNKFWPAKYLVDQNGTIRYYHFGEGNYKETETAIQELLGLDQKNTQENKENGKRSSSITPETYLGTGRRALFTKNLTLQKHEWTTQGSWNESVESISSSGLPAKIIIKSYAKEINLVMGGDAVAEIIVDGKKYKDLAISETKLYNLYNREELSESTLEINFTGGFVEAFAFTFG